MAVARITIAEAKARRDRGEPLVFLDSRNPQAWESSDLKLPGAIRVPPNEVEHQLQHIPQDRTLIPYCT